MAGERELLKMLGATDEEIAQAEATSECRSRYVPGQPQTTPEELALLRKHRNFLSLQGGPAPGRLFEPFLLHRLIHDAELCHKLASAGL